MNFNQQLELMSYYINKGIYPPLSGGYNGVNIYSTNGNHFSDVLESVFNYLKNTEGVNDISIHPFEIKWSMGETILSAKVKTHFVNRFHLVLDCLTGNPHVYLDTMFPMISTFIENGVIRLPNPEEDILDQNKWRENAMDRLDYILSS